VVQAAAVLGDVSDWTALQTTPDHPVEGVGQRCLNDEGVDLLDVSGGTVGLWSELYTNDRGERGTYFDGFARAVKSVARMPVMLTGGIRTATMITRLVEERAVDVVGLARAMALVPDCQPGRRSLACVRSAGARSRMSAHGCPSRC
jgi:2,4-dienoyl-CoA reductase-like NADH-dependent reductase (Old Yellow Enzyme family)